MLKANCATNLGQKAFICLDFTSFTQLQQLQGFGGKILYAILSFNFKVEALAITIGMGHYYPANYNIISVAVMRS